MYECECKKVTVRFPGPQGPTAGIYRQPNTNYNKGECVYLGKEPLNIFLECTATGVTSTDDIVSLPDNKETDDTFIDGTVTWIIRKIVTSNFNGSLKITGDIEANNANIKNETITDSLKVKNDAEIGNNLSVGKKITVPKIIITDEFYIGGEGEQFKPLRPEDIKELYNKIIEPNQTIYISNTGSDEAGDGTSTKPYLTFDFAVTKINKQVPKIVFYLDSRTQEETYHMHPLDLFRQTQIERVEIRAWQNTSVAIRYKANLILEYGKVQCSDNNTVNGDPTRYYWGNMLLNTTTFGQNNNITLYLGNLNISLGTRNKIKNEAKFIALCDNVLGEYVSFNIDDYSIWRPAAGYGKTCNILFDKTKTNKLNYLVINTIISSSTDIVDGGSNIRSGTEGFVIVDLEGRYVTDELINNNNGISPEINQNRILYKNITKDYN